MIIDAHVHLASHDTSRYPLRPSGGTGTRWWESPVSAEDLLVAMDAHGVAKAVAVHSFGAYSFDCAYTIAAPRADPARLRAVVAVDMAGPDPADELRRVAADPLVSGVRLFAAGPDGAAWLDDPGAFAVWDAAGDLGINVVLVARGPQLRKLRPAIEHAPDVVTVLDHCGVPDLVDGRIPADHPALELVDLPQVHLKVTTALLTSAGRAGDPGALVDQLVGAAGAERVAWGSDFPQTQTLDHGEMVALARHATRALRTPDRDAVLGETAERLWWATD